MKVGAFVRRLRPAWSRWLTFRWKPGQPLPILANSGRFPGLIWRRLAFNLLSIPDFAHVSPWSVHIQKQRWTTLVIGDAPSYSLRLAQIGRHSFKGFIRIRPDPFERFFRHAFPITPEPRWQQKLVRSTNQFRRLNNARPQPNQDCTQDI